MLCKYANTTDALLQRYGSLKLITTAHTQLSISCMRLHEYDHVQNSAVIYASIIEEGS